MKAHEIMQKHVITAYVYASTREVAAHMTISRISGFPVIDDERTLVGVLTEFDIIRAIHAGRSLDETLVDEIMTRDVITVDPEDSVDDVMEILEQKRIIRVPVVRDGELLGIVSRGDVLRAALAAVPA